jgi:hypothetical protein
MLTGFESAAAHTLIRAGQLAGPRLSDGFLLLALTEGRPLGPPVRLDVSPAAVRARIGAATPRCDDRALLGALGIDVDEVRRRVLATTGTRPDDPALWQLRRSRVRPLRVTLSGPAAGIVLDASARKVVEVARGTSRRGRRTLVSREDLLWGMLADASSESVRTLLQCGVSLRRLWSDLRHWQQAQSPGG